MTDTTNGADLSATDDLAAFETTFYDADAKPQSEEKPPGFEPEPAPAGDGGEGEGEAPLNDQAKPKKTAQQRIDELTWRANEAERQRQETQRRLEEMLAAQPKPGPSPRSEDEPPSPQDYEFGEDDAAYIRDLTRFETKRELEAEFAAQERQREADRVLAEARNEFDKRKADAFPDGEPDGFKAFCAIEKIPRVLNDVIMVSDMGPQLAAHYGDNPADLQRLSALPPHLQAYEIAKVESRLSGPTAPASAETSKPQPKIATDAPSPAPQVRGAGGQFTVPDDTDDLAAFEKRFYGGR